MSERARLKRRNKDIVKAMKQAGRCVDCGVSDWRVLDYDHIDETRKYASINSMLRDRHSISRIMEEIEKCVLRCANCHRIRSSEQFDWG